MSFSESMRDIGLATILAVGAGDSDPAAASEKNRSHKIPKREKKINQNTNECPGEARFTEGQYEGKTREACLFNRYSTVNDLRRECIQEVGHVLSVQKYTYDESRNVLKISLGENDPNAYEYWTCGVIPRKMPKP